VRGGSVEGGLGCVPGVTKPPVPAANATAGSILLSSSKCSFLAPRQREGLYFQTMVWGSLPGLPGNDSGDGSGVRKHADSAPVEAKTRQAWNFLLGFLPDVGARRPQHAPRGHCSRATPRRRLRARSPRVGESTLRELPLRFLRLGCAYARVAITEARIGRLRRELKLLRSHPL
jgi:hypothetical protein